MKRSMVKICTLICIITVLLVSFLQQAVFAADKTTLKSTILTAYDLDKILYTQATWDVLKTRAAEARSVYLNTAADQAEVDTAASNIQQAMSSLQSAVSIGVLSNNTFSTGDRTSFYPAASYPVFATSAYYTWVSGSTDAAVITNDTNNTNQELRNGSCSGNSATYTTNSTWSTSGTRTATAVFTFDKIYYVNQVDVWTKYVTSSYQAMDYFTVEASVDGVNYIPVKTVNNPNNIAANNNLMVQTIGKFPSVKAKYMKITMHNASGSYMLTLGEIVICGFNIPAGAQNYHVSNVNYYGTADSNKLITLSEATQPITVNVTAENNTVQDKDITMLSAIYSPAGVLVALAADEQQVKANGTKSFSLQFTNLLQGLNDNYTLKTFIWSDLTNCTPLQGDKSFGVFE